MRFPTVKRTIITTVICSSFALIGPTVYGQAYQVQPGDSLYSIAARCGTTTSALQKANGLSTTTIYPGQTLTIATSGYKSTASNYTVKSGDSLYLIAKHYGTSVSSLKQANGLSSNILLIGQTIKIPNSNTTSTSPSTNTYTVQKGDSLFLIAKRYGITTSQLMAANNLGSNSQIYPNQKLTIPTTSAGSSGGVNYRNLTLSTRDLDLLARLVSAEARGESFEGQVAVASTILNRLLNSKFPNTVSGIIYQVDRGVYQYCTVMDGQINSAPTASAIKAVNQAVSGWDASKGATGFYNPAKTSNQWVRSHPITTTIGNHVFYSY